MENEMQREPLAAAEISNKAAGGCAHARGIFFLGVWEKEWKQKTT